MKVNHNKQTILLVLLILFALSYVAKTYSVQQIVVTENVIISSGGVQEFGDVSSDNVLWSGNGSNGFGVYLYNITTQDTAMLSNTGTEYNLSISSKWAVWSSMNTTTEKMEVCKKCTGADPWEVTYQSELDQSETCILNVVDQGSLEKIVFLEKGASSGITKNNVLCWDSLTDSTLLICDVSSNKIGLTLYNNYLFWSDNRSGNYDIWAYDFNSGLSFALVSAPGDQILSSCQESDKIIGTNFIVWMDGRNCTEQNPDNYDIYGKNLITGQVFIVCETLKNEKNPVAFENKVVWIEKDVVLDLYGNQTGWQDIIKIKDINTGIISIIDNSPSFKDYLFLNNDFVIWSETSDLYLTDSTWNLIGYSNLILTRFSVSNFNGKQISRALSGNKVFWSDTRNDYGDLYYATIEIVS